MRITYWCERCGRQGFSTVVNAPPPGWVKKPAPDFRALCGRCESFEQAALPHGLRPRVSERRAAVQ